MTKIKPKNIHARIEERFDCLSLTTRRTYGRNNLCAFLNHDDYVFTYLNLATKCLTLVFTFSNIPPTLARPEIVCMFIFELFLCVFLNFRSHLNLTFIHDDTEAPSTMRIAINGFGRIGRHVLRAAIETETKRLTLLQ